MSRLPNPWIILPVAIAGLAGAAVGFLVTDASCTPNGCAAAASVVATIVGIGTAVGVGIVVVLALKSLSEWRTHADREILTAPDDGPPGPPTC
jgi:hypothetical protein